MPVSRSPQRERCATVRAHAHSVGAGAGLGRKRRWWGVGLDDQTGGHCWGLVLVAGRCSTAACGCTGSGCCLTGDASSHSCPEPLWSHSFIHSFIHSAVCHPCTRLGLGTGTQRGVTPGPHPHGTPSLGARQTHRVRDDTGLSVQSSRERHLA